MELSTLEIVSIGVLLVAVALLGLVVRPAVMTNRERLKDAADSIPPIVLSMVGDIANRAITLAEKQIEATPTNIDDQLYDLASGAVIDILEQLGLVKGDEPAPPAEG